MTGVTWRNRGRAFSKSLSTYEVRSNTILFDPNDVFHPENLINHRKKYDGVSYRGSTREPMSVWIHRKVKTYTLNRIKSSVDINVHLLKEESPKDYTTASSEKRHVGGNSMSMMKILSLSTLL